MPDQTGPTTDTGKAVVTRNPLRHGRYTTPDITVGDEQPGQWQRFCDRVVRNLAPEGIVEEALAHRVAVAFWRLRRVPVAEVLAVDREAKRQITAQRKWRENIADMRRMLPEGNFYRPENPPPTTEITAEPAVLPPDPALREIARYEAHLSRQLFHSLHELEAIQERRKGNPAPLARVDVHGLPT